MHSFWSIPLVILFGGTLMAAHCSSNQSPQAQPTGTQSPTIEVDTRDVDNEEDLSSRGSEEY